MLGVNIGGEQTRDEGVEIMGVSPSGPAQAAGLHKGDVLVAVDGKPLRRKRRDRARAGSCVEHLRKVKPGQVVKLDYLRDGKRQTASVTTGAAEPPMARLIARALARRRDAAWLRGIPAGNGGRSAPSSSCR